MAGSIVVKAAQAPKEFSLEEIMSFLKNVQRRRIFGEIKIKSVGGRFAYVNVSRGLNPGDPLE